MKLFAQMAGAGGSLSSIVRLIGGIAKGLTWVLESVPGAKQLAFAFVGIAGGLKAIKVAAAITGISGLGKSVMGTARAFRLLAAGTAASTVATETSIGATIAAKVAQKAAAGAAKAWAGAQWLLNVALTANPIGAAVVAVTALSVGFVVAYKKVRWFHDAVDSVAKWIQDHYYVLAGVPIVGQMAVVVIALVKNWDKIKAAVVGVWEAIENGVTTAVTFVGNKLSDLATFAQGVPSMIGNAIGSGIGALTSLGAELAGSIVSGFTSGGAMIAGAGSWLVDTAVRAVRALHDHVVGLGGWLLGRVVAGFKTVAQGLGTIGTWLKDQIVRVVHAAVDGFSGLGGWILARVVNGFKTVIAVLATAGPWLKDRIVGGVHDTIDSYSGLGQWVLARVINEFQDGPRHRRDRRRMAEGPDCRRRARGCRWILGPRPVDARASRERLRRKSSETHRSPLSASGCLTASPDSSAGSREASRASAARSSDGSSAGSRAG